MADDRDIGRQLDDAAGLVRIRPKPKPEPAPKKEFPIRALHYMVGKAPLIPNEPSE